MVATRVISEYGFIIRSQLNHREESVFMAKFKLIKPLFTTINQAQDMGKIIVTLIDDNYNRKSGAALINAKNDTQAISSFLNEYKNSSETIRFHAKEIKRLLL